MSQVVCANDEFPLDVELPYCSNEYVQVIQTLLERVVENTASNLDHRFMAAVYEHVTAHQDRHEPTMADFLASEDDFFVDLLLEGFDLFGTDRVYDDPLVWEHVRSACQQFALGDKSLVSFRTN